MRLEFHDLADEGQAGRTRLVLTQGPYGPELEDMARAGWNSSFTKLDGLLAELMLRTDVGQDPEGRPAR